MGYNELEIELTKTLAQIARWREMGYMPTIEQGIALSRLQNVYSGLLDLPCGDLEQPFENTDQTDDVVSDNDEFADMYTEPTGDDRYGEMVAPEYDDTVDFTDLFVEKFAEESVGKFTEEPVKEGEHISDETQLMQEYGSHDTKPLSVESSQEDIVWIEDNEDIEIVVEEKPEESVETTDEQPQSESTEQVTPEPATKMPRIFDVEVNPYARHEIIDTLFHGNIDIFESEVQKMAAMGSLEDVLVYIGETYNWVPENAATIKFIDLLEAKFGE